MKKLIFVLLLLSINTYANFEIEDITWIPAKDWSLNDTELKTYHRLLPMTEESNDILNRLDRRYIQSCKFKTRNLRNLFPNEPLVIAIYAVQDCVKMGLNPHWK